jgi:hypothetical protein
VYISLTVSEKVEVGGIKDISLNRYWQKLTEEKIQIKKQKGRIKRATD